MVHSYYKPRIVLIGPKEGHRLYRFEDGMEETVCLIAFQVLRTTPKGFWIEAYSKEKFVLGLDSDYGRIPPRRYAYELVDNAALSYLRRKERQVLHGQATIERAEDAIFKMTQLGYKES